MADQHPGLVATLDGLARLHQLLGRTLHENIELGLALDRERARVSDGADAPSPTPIDARRTRQAGESEREG